MSLVKRTTVRKAKVQKKKNINSIINCLIDRSDQNNRKTKCAKEDINELEEEVELLQDGGVALTGYSSFGIITNDTLLVTQAGTSSITLTRDAIPPGGPFSWVNFNTGTLAFSPGPGAPTLYTNPTGLTAGPVGVSIDTTAADEHFVIEETGLWLIMIYQRIIPPTVGFTPLRADIGLGITAPGGGGPTVPVGDGFASAGMFNVFVGEAASGTLIRRFEAGTRLDLYIKAESTSPSAVVTLSLDQNGTFSLTRLGP